MVPFSRLRDITHPQCARRKPYPLPHLFLFTVLARMSGARSYRGIITFLEEHRNLLNQHFGVTRAPVNTLRAVLQSLDGEAMERAFRHHAGDLLCLLEADG
jgi:DDE_Tnp_1-associated